MNKNLLSPENVKVFIHEEEAKDYATNKYKELFQKLSKSEKSSLKQYSDQGNKKLRLDIQQYLKTFHGELIKSSSKEGKKYAKDNNFTINPISKWNTMIKKMDAVIFKSKISDSVKIFARPGDEGMIPITHEFRGLKHILEQDKIDHAKFRKIQGDLTGKTFVEESYISGSLLRMEAKEKSQVPALFEYIIPHNSHYIYTKWNKKLFNTKGSNQIKVILPRRTEYKVETVKIVRENTKEIIKIEARILPHNLETYENENGEEETHV